MGFGIKSKVTFSSLGKMGRLGNSMHQIIATVGYGLKHNKYVEFPQWEYSKYFDFPFPENNEIAVDKVYNEPHFHYSEIPYFDSDIDLKGYFQSSLYHDDVDASVLFELKKEYQIYIDGLYAKINPKGLITVSCHIRRGDYLNEAQLAYHGVLPREYYQMAKIKLLQENRTVENFIDREDVIFIIFSDDIEWCKENSGFGKFFNFHNQYFVEGNKDIVDMFLMAKCSMNIITNSSFSWWAAYLNQNKDKMVCAPKYWFTEKAGHNTKDLMPESWVTI